MSVVILFALFGRPLMRFFALIGRPLTCFFALSLVALTCFFALSLVALGSFLISFHVWPQDSNDYSFNRQPRGQSSHPQSVRAPKAHHDGSI
jgi:hypothetical protein